MFQNIYYDKEKKKKFTFGMTQEVISQCLTKDTRM